MDNNCQICGHFDLREVRNFPLLPRITSDCRGYASGGCLFVCRDCGGVQKLADSKWLREIEDIYSGYEAYYQSGGDEQIVFDRVTGKPRRRSDVILERLAAEYQLVAHGRALDVGCGNGATLRAMSKTLTNWSFSGYELGEGSLSRLSSIPRFEKLYTGSLNRIVGTFDLVTLIHTLEHFPSPQKVLELLSPIIENGKIFIEVSNVEENPFDILIADHLMHFSPATLSLLMRQCGFASITIATDWIPKEISLLATQIKSAVSSGKIFSDGKVFDRMNIYVDWLLGTVERVRKLSQEKRSFGIFGTSIAGTWLASSKASIDFFVDEDPSRIGKRHLGKPIFHPSEVPQGAKVYFALAPSLAEKVAARIQSEKFEPVLPLSLEVN